MQTTTMQITSIRAALLSAAFLWAAAAHAGTPGSYFGVAKTGQAFEFSMDGAKYKSSPDHDEEVPSYSSVGVQTRRADGALLVKDARPLPNVCSHKVFKNGSPRLFVCGKGDHPMSNSTYKFKEQRRGARIYVCVTGCSDALPATLSYSELE
jgi:hypothetical protein